MQVLVTLEQRFWGTPDGCIWTATQFPYAFFTRYLEVFDQVLVFARVKMTDTIVPGWRRTDGPGVSFIEMPFYLGPWDFCRQLAQIRRVAMRAVAMADAIILRVPSAIAPSIGRMLGRNQRPYALEVLGDPFDAFAPGSIDHPLRPFFRRYFSRQLAQQCAGASAVAYVTQGALQRRYPPKSNAYCSSYSDVQLESDGFVLQARSRTQFRLPVKMLMVGTLAQLYKAPDVLIDATAACIRQGLDLRLALVGDGQCRVELEARAARLGLGERVRFLGELPAGEPVRAQLDQADLFVLPSRQEGLPRAMIEAMARGLPCIGSAVGGVPELLPAEDLVSPGNARALAVKIHEIVTNPTRMETMSRRNLEKAWDYHEQCLRTRRLGFYRYVRQEAEKRLGS
jgi:glycosyltransferase involved in cell wall biosynthesis